jgi:hypothetical protein
MAGPIRDDSAGEFGQWINPDDWSWLDSIKAAGSDTGNALSNLGRNVLDGISPFAPTATQYGKPSLQVPPMIQGIADSYSRLAGTPSQPGNAYDLTGIPELDRPIQQDMSNVLLSMYGGNAVSGIAKPKGALGKGKVATEAVEPLSARVYRGASDANALEHPSATQFFSDDAAIANLYAKDFRGVGRSVPVADDQIIYTNADRTDSLRSPDPSYPFKMTGDAISYADGSGVAPYDIKFKNPQVIEGPDLNRMIDAEQGFGVMDILPGLASRAVRDGHDGLVLGNVTDIGGIQNQYIPLQRGTVYSPFNGDLVFSDTGKPSLLGSALATAGESIKDKAQAVYRDVRYSNEPSASPPNMDLWNEEIGLRNKVRNMQQTSGAQSHVINSLKSPETLNDMGLSALDGYDVSALNQAWRNKVRQTGELFSDNKPSILGSALATAGEQPKGITAYHGSPHDFDKFSLDKIGTGEGAQAYGHGLYFAENEGVAKSYRDLLSGDTSNPVGRAAFRHGQFGGAANEFLFDDIADYAASQRRIGNETEAAAALEDLDLLQRAGDIVTDGQKTGRMYQVRINADPESFLDWDKPLSQQPQAARSAIESDPIFSTEMYSSAPDNTMRNLLRDPSTTSKLREAGIPGIRYLDGNSRADGAGSSNYVVFDDSLIEIMKKYGLAGGVVGAGALSQPDNANAQDTPPWLQDILSRY